MLTAGPQQCDAAVNKKRPVNLDIGTIRLPITAYASILHRASGVFLFVGVAVLLWMLDLSLSGEEGFAQVQVLFDSFFVKLIVWAVLAGLIYHTAAGIRHLIMDMGIGESKEQGPRFAKVSVALSVVVIAALGVWIW